MALNMCSIDDTAVDLLQRILNMNPDKVLNTRDVGHNYFTTQWLNILFQRFSAESSMDHLYFWKGEGTLPHERC